jgi:hypothetical protein
MKKVSKEIKPCEKLAKNFLSELKIPNSPTGKLLHISNCWGSNSGIFLTLGKKIFLTLIFQWAIP